MALKLTMVFHSNFFVAQLYSIKYSGRPGLLFHCVSYREPMYETVPITLEDSSNISHFKQDTLESYCFHHLIVGTEVLLPFTLETSHHILK